MSEGWEFHESWEEHADNSATDSGEQEVGREEDEEPGAKVLPSETWSLCESLHYDSEEAKLRAEEGREGSFDQWDGGDRIHPGGWT